MEQDNKMKAILGVETPIEELFEEYSDGALGKPRLKPGREENCGTSSSISIVSPKLYFDDVFSAVIFGYFLYISDGVVICNVICRLWKIAYLTAA